MAKLTWESVGEIRQIYAEGNLSQTEIAMVFGITQSNVGYIVRGKTWKQICP